MTLENSSIPANQEKQKSNHSPMGGQSRQTAKRASAYALDQRIVITAWALFFIFIGILWLAPVAWIPPGTWALGVGIILIGLNIARIRQGLCWCSLTFFLGIGAVACGLGSLVGLGLPLLPLLLIIFGLAMIINRRK